MGLSVPGTARSLRLLRVAAFLLALPLARAPVAPPQTGSSPQQAFTERLIPLVAGEPGADDAALRALVREAPFRAETVMQELLYQAAVEGPGSGALGAARRIAQVLDAEGASTAALEAVRVTEGLDEAGRRRRVECDRALARTFEAANARRWEEAETSARAMVELAAPLGLPFVEARSRRALGRILADRGEYAGARAELERALALDTARGAPIDVMEDERALGDTELRAGRPARALEHFEASVAAMQDAGAPFPLADHLRLASLFAFYGRYDDARTNLEAVLGGAREPSDLRGRALTDLATVASSQGDYGEALRLLGEAAEVWRAIGDEPGLARTLVIRGGIDSELGRTADAEASLASALGLLGEGATLDRARAELTLGLARIDAGRPGEALEPLERALATFEAVGFELGRGEALHQRARALADLGRAAEAEDAWRAAIELHRTSGDGFRLALALTELGRVLENTGRAGAAAEAYRTALAEAAGLDSAEATWRAHGGLGRIEEAAGRPVEAIGSYRAALEGLEHIRAQLGAPSLRLRYLEDKLELYRRATHLLARSGQRDEAFRWTEAAKARTLLELGAGAVVETGTDDLRGRLRALTTQLAAVEESLSSARRDGAGDELLDSLAGRVASLREERSRARTELELARPEDALLSGTSALATLGEVLAALPASAALIEYLVADDFAAAWVLRRDSVRFVELGCTGREVAAWVDRLDRPLADLRAGRTDVASLDFDVEAARALYRALVAPLAEDLGASELVWIVADGPLWSVPFGALVVDYEKRPVDPARLYLQYAGCRFWLEEHALGLAPCASFLARRSDRLTRPAARLGALGVFDPLPLPADALPLRAAQGELASVRARFRPRGTLLLSGAEATEARFESELGAAAWIHVAAHGYLDDERPEYSRIALVPSADGSEDGWLHAFEIEGHPLVADSVVLTACETAGTSLRAEGLLGLARAFLVAGAGSVVASRWLVDDDAAALLVDRYYAALGRGERPPAALRNAQLEVLRHGGRPGLAYAHPFFWAGYVHFGGRE